MRGISFLPLLLFAGAAQAAGRLPLDLPVHYPGASAARIAAPAYAGDVVEIALTPFAAQRARQSIATGTRLSRLGVADLDRLATDLGGAWFERQFPGERPPAVGSTATDFTSYYVVHLPPGLTLETALDHLGSSPSVACASPISIMRMSAVPNDSLFASSYWWQSIQASNAWDLTTGDTSVVVGILDTGVLFGHPDLTGTTPGRSGQIWTNWAEAGGVSGVDDDGNGYVDDLHGWDFVSLPGANLAGAGEDWRDPDNDPNDFAAHGTAVAGVVGAIAGNLSSEPGTVWNTRLMPLRVGWWPGGALGDGLVRMDFVACAILYAARNGAQVLNCSFETDNGLGVPDTCTSLSAALDAAHAAGVTIVTSAGNDGGPIVPARSYFSTLPEIISVASTNPFDYVSSFSNRGPEVDISAPGEALASTWMLHDVVPDSVAKRVPTYRGNLSGTSIAAPLVAGAAALLQAGRRQLHRDPMPPEGVLLRLWDTADDISAQNPGLVGQYGGGRLNLERALRDTGSTVTRLGGRVNGAPAVFRTNGPEGMRIACAIRDDAMVILSGVTRDTIAVAPLFRNPTSGVTVGRLSDSGGVGLFVGANGGVAGFRPNGATLPGWPGLGQPGIQFLQPAVADLEGDGNYEIVSGADDGKVYAWHANGSPVWPAPVQVMSSPGLVRVALAPLTGTAETQIIAAGEDGTVTVLRPNGSVLPGLWPVSLPGQPSAPVVVTWGGLPTVVVAAGFQLHAFWPDGGERPGYPAALTGAVVPGEEPALGDADLDQHTDIVLATDNPPTLDVRDSTGVSKSGWPRALAVNPIGSPVVGDLAAGGTPEIMVFLGTGLAAFTSAGVPLAKFPKPGGAGHRPFLADLDGDTRTDVVAGSGPAEPLLYVYRSAADSYGPWSAPGEWSTYRGGPSRTGSAGSSALPVADVLAPGTVSDLRGTLRSGGTVTLEWTAPGNDGSVGRATSYDMRRATVPLQIGNFETGTPVATGVPHDPGTTDSTQVSGLLEGVTYHFAIRAADADGNLSAVSNDVAVTIPATSPAMVGDLRAIAVTDTSVTLRWTASGEDGMSGRARLYVVRADTRPLDDATYAAAPYEEIVNATVDAGGTENLLFQFLERGKRYWFALKAYDSADNGSPLSNVVVAQTGVGGPLSGKLGLAVAPGSNPSRVPAQLYWQADPAALGARQVIGIHDLFGRRVRSIELGTGVGGVAAWDGLDGNGNRLPAGVYVVRFESGRYHKQARLVLLP